MNAALGLVLEILELESMGGDAFRGLSPADGRPQVFGGQLSAQAVVAAGRTVSSGRLHSFHAYFLRPADPSEPVVYRVGRRRDGRSFLMREVTADQGGDCVFDLRASFHVDEPGPDRQEPMPEVAAPEGLPPYPDPGAARRGFHQQMPDWVRAVDLRFVGSDRGLQRAWLRADGPVPDQPILHAAVMALASDLTLLDTVVSADRHHTGSGPPLLQTSLDHAMWFHRGFRSDEWLLYEQHTPTSHGARGLALGRFFSRHGDLVASVAQEGLVRPFLS